MNGMEMMLKSAGIDLPKLTADFEQLKKGVVDTLTSIDTRLQPVALLDARLQRIEETMEKLWKMMEAQQVPAQPLAAQSQPNHQPPLHLVKQ